ncbi:MAG: glycosyltransferase family 9 protein [Bdellovibrionales bacterium]
MTPWAYPMTAPTEKFLILRFSSFGDVTQCLSVPSKIAEKFPKATIHWAVRADLSSLLENHPHIHRIWAFPRKAGLRELWQMGVQLQAEGFTHVYDAHNSTRSLFLSLFLKLRNPGIQLLRKSQKRWKRILLFKFRINRYRQPFSGQRDLLEPLKKWGLSEDLPSAPQLFLQPHELQRVRDRLPASPFVALAPSAAYELKRWPRESWKALVQKMPKMNFVLLGGPEDVFLEEIRTAAPDRVINLAGRTNLRETSAVVAQSLALVTNDTGILHTAEQQGHPAVALMGPAPFGFPSRSSTSILERNLPCRPCSKHGQGPCVNPNFHQCLRSITPEDVMAALRSRGISL